MADEGNMKKHIYEKRQTPRSSGKITAKLLKKLKIK